MTITRRQFLRGIIATGAAAAVPAFIIRREPEPEFAPDGWAEADTVKILDDGPESFTGESLFVPGKGESFSNLCSPTSLTRENFDRVRAAMLRQMREPLSFRPPVMLLPPKLYDEYRQFFS